MWHRASVGSHNGHSVDLHRAFIRPIVFLDAATGEDRSIAVLVDPVYGDPRGLAVAPDDGSLFYTKAAAKGSDLLLIENFR
jgi:hypothetical protein